MVETETFYALVKPVILYACESWGNDISGSLNNTDSICKDSFEKLHIKICKQILCTHRKTMNTTVLAELSRFPMTPPPPPPQPEENSPVVHHITYVKRQQTRAP